jgi:hypothetical protein
MPGKEHRAAGIRVVHDRVMLPQGREGIGGILVFVGQPEKVAHLVNEGAVGDRCGEMPGISAVVPAIPFGRGLPVAAGS